MGYIHCCVSSVLVLTAGIYRYVGVGWACIINALSIVNGYPSVLHSTWDAYALTHCPLDDWDVALILSV